VTEETYQKLQQFKAAGGEYTIEPSFANASCGGCNIVYILVMLNYHGHKVSDVSGTTTDRAVFAAFDQLRYVLPESVWGKWK
jgi:hypothetical protein